MQTQSTATAVYPSSEPATSFAFDGHMSGVSWAAVLAGAAASAALSFVLLILGLGLGLSSVSPWSYSAEAIGTSTVTWLAFTQLAAAGVGGYIAGRLRVKWASVDADEVYFRDTAHGLLAWSVATLLTAALMAGAVRAVLGGAVDVAAGTANAAAAAPAVAKSGIASNIADPAGASLAYFTDVLLRPNQATPATDNGALQAEVGKIFANDLRAGAMAPDDRQYLAQLLARRTGMTAADAERRVDDVYARLSKARDDAEAATKAAADKARKAAAHSALWMFVALLLGAFIASLCATIGGRQRDRAVTARHP